MSKAPAPVRWRAKPYRPIRRTPDLVLMAKYPGLLRASSRSLLRIKPGKWRERFYAGQEGFAHLFGTWKEVWDEWHRELFWEHAKPFEALGMPELADGYRRGEGI